MEIFEKKIEEKTDCCKYNTVFFVFKIVLDGKRKTLNLPIFPIRILSAINSFLMLSAQNSIVFMYFNDHC